MKKLSQTAGWYNETTPSVFRRNEDVSVLTEREKYMGKNDFREIYVCSCVKDVEVSKGKCTEKYEKGACALIRLDRENVYIIPADRIRGEPSSSDSYRWLSCDDTALDQFSWIWGAAASIKPNDVSAFFEVDDKETKVFRKHMAMAKSIHDDTVALYTAEFVRMEIEDHVIHTDWLDSISILILVCFCGVAADNLFILGAAVIIIIRKIMFRQSDLFGMAHTSRQGYIEQKECTENYMLDAVRMADGWLTVAEETDMYGKE